MYTSLFEHWKTILSSQNSIEEIVEDLKKDLGKVQGIIPSTLILHDYRDFGISFISDNVFGLTGYYPENYYSNGIELDLKLLHPNHLSEVLVFQKKAFDFIQKVPVESRFSIQLRYNALVKNRSTEVYKYYHVVFRPLIFDKNGNVLIDLATWTEMPLFQGSTKFEWKLSYEDKQGVLIEKSSLVDEVDVSQLSPAENRVYKHLITGKHSDEIGNILNLSKHTIDTHRRKILKKMNVNSTSELIAKKKNHLSEMNGDSL